MQFKEAKEKDFERIAGFLVTPDELFFFHPKAIFPLTADQLLPNFQSRKGNTVLIADGEIAGFANFISVTDGISATIGNVVVDPDRRGTGLGKALIDYMETSAKALFDVKKIFIPCFNTNTAGLCFYHKLGYVPNSGEPRFNQDGDSVYLIYFAKSV